MTRHLVTRLTAAVRQQTVLIARDPGPLIGYAVMGLLLMTVTRPLYSALGRLIAAPAVSAAPGVPAALAGTDQAAAGMAVMFSLFALKVGAAHLLNERRGTPGTGWPPARPASPRSLPARACRCC